MREIKFKFWDEDSKIMLGWMCVCQTAFNRSDESWQYGLMYRMFTEYRYIKLQFTGLKDKNQKDIYFDSDILRDDDMRTLFIITQCKFGIKLKRLPNGYLREITDIDLEHLSVIGNVYENPELLGEES